MDEALERYLKAKKAYENNIAQIDKEIAYNQAAAKHWANEAERISYNLDNADKILSELSNEFKNGTALSSKDMEFLFFAVALQCCRWYFQPKINPDFERKLGRKTSTEGAQYEKTKIREYAQNNADDVIKSRKYPDKEKIFIYAVPYDAMEGTEKVEIEGVTKKGKNINGVNHHAATLGHDPILGYIFGTINILTRTITFKTPTLTTKTVHIHSGTANRQYVGNNISIPEVLQKTMETASEDIMRVPAAVTRQAIHIQSDKYTKQGLPIPFIAPDKAQQLLNKGWNSYELERLAGFLAKNAATISVQAMLSMLINVVIETLYKLTYGMEEKSELVDVKSRKIIMYSNTIASTSNVIYTAITRNIGNLDIGGLLVTIYRIATDTKMIKQIRDEYVYGTYEKSLELRDFIY